MQQRSNHRSNQGSTTTQTKDKKAIRNCDIETSFIKISKIPIAKFLRKTFNSCLELGFFPDDLKIAEVIPVFKKGNPAEATNYRPISILSQFSKIFEKLLFIRIINYFEKYDFLLSKDQYGFRKNSSTMHAVTNIHNGLMINVDKGLHWSTRFFLHGVFQRIWGNLRSLNSNLALVFAYHVKFLGYKSNISKKITFFPKS